MANIGGAPDDKEQQCGDSECHGRLGKEDSKQMQTGGGTAAKEGGDEVTTNGMDCRRTIGFFRASEYTAAQKRQDPGSVIPGSLRKGGR
jgi:hypothetical protein